MRGHKRDKRIADIARTVCIWAMLILAIVAFATAASAKTRDTGGIFTGADGRTRRMSKGKPKVGLYRVGEDLYYGHKTSTAQYKRGMVTADAFRIIDGRLYYFCTDGKMLRKDTGYIKLRPDHSVLYIYTPGTGRTERYNALERRYEIKGPQGWKLVEGMQYWPEGAIDGQP